MVPARAVLPFCPTPLGQVALRIDVDQKHTLLGQGQRRGQIDGRGRLSDAALLVRDRDYSGHTSLKTNGLLCATTTFVECPISSTGSNWC